MASPSNPNPPTHGSNKSSPKTTFVQADPSNFRTIVQILTGSTNDPSTQKPPPIHHHNQTRPNSSTPLKKLAFNLHERTQNLKLNNLRTCNKLNTSSFFVSPVSILDHCLSARVINSPKSPHKEAEERAITKKGFYLHPILAGDTPRGYNPPKLLPLFPLRSPGDVDKCSPGDVDKCCIDGHSSLGL